MKIYFHPKILYSAKVLIYSKIRIKTFGNTNSLLPKKGSKKSPLTRRLGLCLSRLLALQDSVQGSPILRPTTQGFRLFQSQELAPSTYLSPGTESKTPSHQASRLPSTRTNRTSFQSSWPPARVKRIPSRCPPIPDICGFLTATGEWDYLPNAL